MLTRARSSGWLISYSRPSKPYQLRAFSISKHRWVPNIDNILCASYFWDLIYIWKSLLYGSIQILRKKWAMSRKVGEGDGKYRAMSRLLRLFHRQCGKYRAMSRRLRLFHRQWITFSSTTGLPFRFLFGENQRSLDSGRLIKKGSEERFGCIRKYLIHIEQVRGQLWEHSKLVDRSIKYARITLGASESDR